MAKAWIKHSGPVLTESRNSQVSTSGFPKRSAHAIAALTFVTFTQAHAQSVQHAGTEIDIPAGESDVNVTDGPEVTIKAPKKGKGKVRYRIEGDEAGWITMPAGSLSIVHVNLGATLLIENLSNDSQNWKITGVLPSPTRTKKA